MLEWMGLNFYDYDGTHYTAKTKSPKNISAGSVKQTCLESNFIYVDPLQPHQIFQWPTSITSSLSLTTFDQFMLLIEPLQVFH